MLFAGRQSQINDVINAVMRPGQHVILYGERGVGKTSLAKVLIEILSEAGQHFLNSGTINCDGTDTFTSLWKKVFRELLIETESQRVGFGEESHRKVISLVDWVPEEATPDDIRYALNRMSGNIIISLDELDRIKQKEVTTLLADTLKNLSDHNVQVTLILVGVADVVDDLIAEHRSVERALVQVQMPRMSGAELRQIIERGLEQAEMTIQEDAKDKITHLSQGLPHYTHLLALHAAQHAINRGSIHVTDADVREATKIAVEKSHSLLSAYNKATSSPQKSLYHQVLSACALAPTDELGYFSAAAVAKPLSAIMGRSYDVPSFARHLTDFASDDRGGVLTKTGKARRYRYRFENPLMQPFVIIHGLSTGLLSEDLIWISRK
jgi:Cdc6-like AAA superfamily ATPase